MDSGARKRRSMERIGVWPSAISSIFGAAFCAVKVPRPIHDIGSFDRGASKNFLEAKRSAEEGGYQAQSLSEARSDLSLLRLGAEDSTEVAQRMLAVMRQHPSVERHIVGIFGKFNSLLADPSFEDH